MKLIDANFIWTEPHSKRIKLKIVLQVEANKGAMIQQACLVTFIVHNFQCPKCTKEFTNATWKAQVQVRQKVDHKRTFYYLEQLILSAQAHAQASNIDSVKDGIDVFFTEKKSAEKFVEFVASCLPVRSKVSRKLISSDNHNNTANIKLTTLVEICMICKHDIVVLSKKMAAACGQIARLVIISKIASQIHIVDPLSSQRATLTGTHYWRDPFTALLSARALIVYTVLDVEPVEPISKLKEEHGTTRIGGVCDIVVARERDFGVNDVRFLVRSHLGRYLHPGDSVSGYELTTCNISSDSTTTVLPEIVLIQRNFSKTNNTHSKKSTQPLGSLNMRETQVLRKGEEEVAAQEYAAFCEEFSAQVTMEED